ncbi:hypothetical protein Trydic_g3247 [Trypoxylus dichotomus]
MRGKSGKKNPHDSALHHTNECDFPLAKDAWKHCIFIFFHLASAVIGSSEGGARSERSIFHLRNMIISMPEKDLPEGTERRTNPSSLFRA